MGGWKSPIKKIAINFLIEKNHIGSAVSEILPYRQTDTQRSFYFIIRIIILISSFWIQNSTVSILKNNWQNVN